MPLWMSRIRLVLRIYAAVTQDGTLCPLTPLGSGVWDTAHVSNLFCEQADR